MNNFFKKLRLFSTYKKEFHKNGIYGWEAFKIFFDVLYCRRKFHCKLNEYLFYDFQNKSNRVRKDYLLRYHQRIRYRLVDGDTDSKLSSKQHQYETFGDMLSREWLMVDGVDIQTLSAFVEKHGRVILKPDFGSQGKGVYSLKAEEIPEKLLPLYGEIKGKNYICEQYLVQHSAIAAVNPSSVNTIRIFTLCDGKSVKITSAALRTGGAESVCDNMSAGGVGASVDIESGVVCTRGIDFEKNIYMYHPATGVQFLGLQIPFWEEVKNMVKVAAMRAKTTAVFGWDIAITENGPAIIEVNKRPAGRLAQISSGAPCGREIIDFIDSNKARHRKLTREQKKAVRRFK